MPTRSRAREGVDPLLKHDAKFYKKAWEKMHHAEKISNDRALAHKFLWDKLKKLKPNSTAEDLMALAHHLEDQGQLEEAVDAYQKLITGPQFQQQDNMELRAHLAELVARVNRRQAELQALRRNADFEEDGRPQPGRPRGLEPPRGAGVPRSDKPNGPQMPMSPEAYRAELAAQAMEVRRRREAEKRRDELLDAKQVAVAAAMDALEKYNKLVGGGNEKAAHAREMELERRNREEERRRQFFMDWDEMKAAAEVGPGGPLGGDDEYARRRAQVQAAHAHRALFRNSLEAPSDPRAVYHDAYGHDPRVMQEELATRQEPGGAGRGGRGRGGGGAYQDQYYYQPNAAVAAGLRRRPASASAVAAARAKERERMQELDRNNVANFQRLYVPGHPYAPTGGPPPPAAAWPAPPAAAPAKPAKPGQKGAGAGGGKAPFARPDVDRPKVPIDPKAVRARQQVFLDKHRKPAPPQKQQQQVPLRARKEAERRPSQPVVAPGAYAAW